MKKIAISPIILIVFILLISTNISAQKTDSSGLNYNQLLGLALNTNIQAILKILDTAKITSKKDQLIKLNFENRFKYESDKTDYFNKPDTSLNPLLRIFQDYWRKSMLDNKTSYDKYAAKKIISFLKSENSRKKFTDKKISKRTIKKGVYKTYIQSKGYYCTDIGKTGNLYDFLVWKKETDTTYRIVLINDTAKVNVQMMDDFYSLGWEEYATLGACYPGGWTTPTSLYCVKKAYDLNSESFIVNYLSHEGQHFLDMQHYPKLSSNDLEYRAKLIELYLCDQNLYACILMFINSANYDKNNSHPYADYCLIRDMSKELFKNDFEKDIEKWKSLPKERIHEAAKKLFIQNTDNLNKIGKSVKNYIK